MLLPPSLERTTRRWQHSSLKQERVMSRPARTRNPGTNMHDTLQRSVRVRQNRLNTIIIIMTVTCMASARSRPDEDQYLVINKSALRWRAHKPSVRMNKDTHLTQTLQ